MAIITSSIGTATRDYSTISAWEADLDNAGVYSAADDAVGECYDDSAFDEDVLINGGGTIGLASITLTVAAAERHDGTAGTGARVVRTANAAPIIISVVAIATDILWLEIDMNGNNINFNGNFVDLNQGGTATRTVHRMILHDSGSGNNRTGTAVEFKRANHAVTNCVVYDVGASGTNDEAVLETINTGTSPLYCQNNTLFNNSSGASGILIVDVAGLLYQNNIAFDTTGNDYSNSAPANATVDHNAASDTTASGTGSLDSQTAADWFVSTTGGSEDLHLKSGANGIDGGTDLGTTPAEVNIDIDGRDRDAEGDTWDIGADEFVSAAPAALPVGTLALLGVGR